MAEGNTTTTKNTVTREGRLRRAVVAKPRDTPLETAPILHQRDFQNLNPPPRFARRSAGTRTTANAGGATAAHMPTPHTTIEEPDPPLLTVAQLTPAHSSRQGREGGEGWQRRERRATMHARAPNCHRRNRHRPPAPAAEGRSGLHATNPTPGGARPPASSRPTTPCVRRRNGAAPPPPVDAANPSPGCTCRTRC